MTSNRGYPAIVNLIVHANQSQPVGRRGRPRVCAIKALKCCRYTRRCSPPSTHFGQRPDNRPNHVAQEAISRGSYQDFVRDSLDIQADQRANMVLSVRTCNGERGEVMCANKRGRGLFHLLYVKARAIVMDISINKRTDHFTSP